VRHLILAAGSVLVIVVAASAQTMRCGPRIIQPGDSEYAVLALCGQPAAARHWVETFPTGDDYQGVLGVTQIPMDEWDYQNGPDQFVNKVIFRDGVVAEIKN
jgi:hypothetical protein